MTILSTDPVSLTRMLEVTTTLLKMPDESQSDRAKGEEATVGLNSDVKTIQQLTSSAEAAKKHREASKDERAKRNLDEAIGKMMKDQQDSSHSTGKGDVE